MLAIGALFGLVSKEFFLLFTLKNFIMKLFGHVYYKVALVINLYLIFCHAGSLHLDKKNFVLFIGS